MNSTRSRWIYGILFGLFVLFIILREFVWRFTSPFVMDLHGVLSSGSDSVLVTIHESTETPVDSVLEEFSDPRKGKTLVTVTTNPGGQRLSFIGKGHYYSSAIPLTFSGDRAKEIFLIPNTEQGLPLGVGELLYLDTAARLSTLHVESPNMGDVDSDGVYELYDRVQKKFLHLDRATKSWQPAHVTPRRYGAGK